MNIINGNIVKKSVGCFSSLANIHVKIVRCCYFIFFYMVFLSCSISIELVTLFFIFFSLFSLHSSLRDKPLTLVLFLHVKLFFMKGRILGRCCTMTTCSHSCLCFSLYLCYSLSIYIHLYFVWKLVRINVR